ncbi:MAG: arsenate reductase ArsC [Acidobacteriota bacterium]|nr:MAG: arsenate reductase ArsC [Acidobacteriota bacterium]
MKGVLFLCTGNSCRSQMAEGIGRRYAPRGVEIWSAGVAPVGVHPLAVRVMKEAGMDISGQTSKSVGSVPLERIDTLITLCGYAAARCPHLGASLTRLHWPIEDPVGAAGTEEERLEAFRRTRDEIERRIRGFFHSTKVK